MSRLPPAEKLPLAVRKNVRDEWANKKEETEKKFSDLLGAEWKIEIDENSIFPYAEENSYGRDSLGSCIYSYVDGALYQLQYQIEKTAGEVLKDDINSIAHAHVLTMDFDEEKLFSYCGAKVNDGGQLVILFGENYLGTNTSNAFEVANIKKALDSAPSSQAMNHTARYGIKEDYEPKIEAAQAELNRLLGKKIPFSPNFEAVYKKLSASKTARDDWHTNLGSFTLKYLEGLNYYLKYQKFDMDDMLQEGLTEALENNAVHFRIVDKTKRSYNEAVVEDGILYLQTTPDNWGTNIDNIAEGLIELL